MAILFFIIKFIGILLLVCLGVFLLLVILALTVPVRYRVSAILAEDVTVHARITWLFSMISFRLDVQNGNIDSGLRILGIRKRAKAARVHEEENNSSAEKPTIQASFAADEPCGTEPMTESAERQSSKDTGMKDLWTAPKRFFGRIKQSSRRFFQKLRRIKNVLPQLWERAAAVRDIVSDETNHIACLAVLEELRYLFRHFRFRRLSGDLQFSAGDPALTGQALGMLAMFPLIYRYQVAVAPDFESEQVYVKGSIDLKGRMRGIHAAVSLVRLLKQREVRLVLKRLFQ